MSGGEIAGIIFASGFVLLVLLIGIPLSKLGKLLDEGANAVRAVNAEIEPMLAEVRVTLTEANKQLKRIDGITKDVEQFTENISSLVAVFTAAVGMPLTRILGVTKGIFRAFGKRR